MSANQASFDPTAASNEPTVFATDNSNVNNAADPSPNSNTAAGQSGRVSPSHKGEHAVDVLGADSSSTAPAVSNEPFIEIDGQHDPTHHISDDTGYEMDPAEKGGDQLVGVSTEQSYLPSLPWYTYQWLKSA